MTTTSARQGRARVVVPRRSGAPACPAVRRLVTDMLAQGLGADRPGAGRSRPSGNRGVPAQPVRSRRPLVAGVRCGGVRHDAERRTRAGHRVGPHQPSSWPSCKSPSARARSSTRTRCAVPCSSRTSPGSAMTRWPSFAPGGDRGRCARGVRVPAAGRRRPARRARPASRRAGSAVDRVAQAGAHVRRGRRA